MFEKLKAEGRAQKDAKELIEESTTKCINAKRFILGNVKPEEIAEPYLILMDNPTFTGANTMGIPFHAMAIAVNILAKEHGYRIVTTACDNHTMYTFMEKRQA